MSTRSKHDSEELIEELIAWRDRFEQKRADYAELAKLAEETIAYAGYWKRECRKHQERIRALETALTACVSKLGEYEDPNGGFAVVQGRQTLSGTKEEA